MNAFHPIVPLLVAAAALVVAYLALLAVRRLHHELVSVRRELVAQREQLTGAVAAATAELLPAARSAAQGEEIRAAVADALAEERERELAEARAFWAAHEAREARDATDAPAYEGAGYWDARAAESAAGPEDPADADGTAEPGPGRLGSGHFGYDGHGGAGPGSAAYLDLPEFEALPLLPRQIDRLTGGDPEAARRRHPSDPDFAPSPVVADPEQTVARLAELAEAGTPLADVRPGPMGTLDLYVFTDGTTLCLTPGHSETAGQLAAALDRGEQPVLLGGSGIAGAYALTFTFGGESVFILADRVVASL